MIPLLSGGAASLTAVAAATLLLSLLPFLLSLAGQGSKATMLCLFTSTLALLLSAQPGRVGMVWITGMVVALVSVWDRIRQRYPL